MSISWAKLCRLCANFENCESVLFNSDGEKKGILQFIEKNLNSSISPTDGLPFKICLECTDKVTDFQNYIIRCGQIQQFFEKHNPYTTQLNSIEQLESLKTEFIFPEAPREIKQEIFFDDGIDIDDDHITTGSVKFVPLSEFVSNQEVLGGSGKHKKIKKKRIRKKQSLKLKKEIKNENLLTDDLIENEDDSMNGINLTKDTNIPNKVEKNKKIGKRKIKKYLFKFNCHMCDEVLRNWSALSLHVMRIHKSKAKVLCVCSQYLSSYRSVVYHTAKHSETTDFQCTLCDKAFGFKKDLDRHLLRHKPKDELPYVCCKCAKHFATARCLKKHETTHQPKEERCIWSCDVCEMKFVTKGGLMNHKRVVHEKLKPFICDLCGLTFSSKNNMEDHRVKHSDEKKFECNTCKKGFKTKASLVRHLDTHSDTAYQCPHCPKLLNSKRTLRNHMFVHDDTAEHRCPFCDKGFKRRKECKIHVKIHTGEKPYSCPWCPRTFTNGSNCRIHKRRMHPQEFAIAETKNPFAPSNVLKPEPKKIIQATFKNPAIDKITFNKINAELAASKENHSDDETKDNT